MNRKRIVFILAIALFVFVAQGISEAAEPKMFWIEERGYNRVILRANLDGTNVEELVTRERVFLSNLALDMVGGKIYWIESPRPLHKWMPGKILCMNLDSPGEVEDFFTAWYTPNRVWQWDESGGRIGTFTLDVAKRNMYLTESWKRYIRILRVNLDGTREVEKLLADENWRIAPSNIVLDVAGGKMYWWSSNTLSPGIQRANLDGTDLEKLPDLNPYDLVLDVTDRKMYWTLTWRYYFADGTSEHKGLIQRSNMDGSHVEDHVTGNVHEFQPFNLALDIAGGKMYWTNISKASGRIQRSNLNGSHVEDLVTGLNRSISNFALDVADRKMYWTNQEQGKIQRSNMDGSPVEDLVTGLETYSFFGLVIPESSGPTSPDQNPPTDPEDVDGDDGGTPGDTVSDSDPAPFLREPNLPVGYGYTEVALGNSDTLQGAADVLSIAYLSDDIVAHGSTHDSHDIRVWDIAKEALITKLDGHKGDVTSLAHLPDSPDGAILASGSKDNTIRLWTRNGNNWTSKRIGDHRGDVTCLVYLPGNPDGATFASGGTDGKVHLWKWNGGKWQSEELVDHAPGWFNTLRVESLAYNAKRKTLASRSTNTDSTGTFLRSGGKVFLSKWDGNRWQSEQLPGVEDKTGSLAYSPGGTLALGTEDGMVALDEGETTRALEERHHHRISSLAYSPDGTTLASGSRGDLIFTGHLVLTDTNTLEFIELDEASITSLAYSPNGTTLASGMWGSQAVQIWDLTPSKDTKDIDANRFPKMVSDVALTTNATYFVFTPKFAKVTRFGDDEDADKGVDYGECRITLHFPKGSKFFLMPLQTLEAQRAAAVQKAKADLKITVGTGLLGQVPVVNWFVSFLDIAGSVFNYVKAVEAFSKTAAAEALGQVQITLVPGSGQSAGYPNAQEIPLVVLIESQSGGKITSLEFTIEQEYQKGENSYTSVARGQWDFESAAPAAPHAQPMSLSDYPPFQSLPLEVQHYLLREFAEPRIAVAEMLRVPEETSLLPNYPNPFNPETWIPYQLAEPADVTLTIYDIKGNVVRDIDLGHQRAGIYESKSRAAYWDGRNAHGEAVASGVYFYTLKAGDFSATRKMLIRK